jgi:peptidoglycan/LPS O-acetylase OafA/YrhL
MAAVGFDDIKTRGQPWQFLQEIGNASYSIYLTHFFVVGVLIAFANHAHLSPALRTLLALIAIPLTAIVGIGVYRFFERPVMSVLERRKPADNARAQHVSWKDHANDSTGDLKQS